MKEQKMKINGEQVIKALECCTNRDKPCGECILHEDKLCTITMANGALSLIKELTEENERLRGQNIDLAAELKKCLKAGWAVEVHTVRKMQERLIECFNNEVDHLSMYTEAQVIFAIDQIAKEMVEGK